MKNKIPPGLTVNSEDAPSISTENNFLIVGIGASAGGLDAFKKLVKAIPEKSGMAYILVQHLDPNHESILPGLLQKTTSIPVKEIMDNVRIEPDNIYIIPSNKLLAAEGNTLKLTARPREHKNLPIDLFFESLAAVHGEHAIGIVLSGALSDGTLGLKSIKKKGGYCFAQDPKSAAYSDMPQTAIDSGVVDFILLPEKMPEQLGLLNQSYKWNKITKPGAAKDEIPAHHYKEILGLLQDRKGVDFNYYKQTTIRRRISRRMQLSGKDNMKDYLDFIGDNKPELDLLFQDLLIPVTAFFRDASVFSVLTETVFPVLLKKNDNDQEPLRIWIAGCSSGEEVYSIVISLHEFFADRDAGIRLQVFATDISEPAIKKARSGEYKKSEMHGVSPERIRKFFKVTDGKYQVNKNIREGCVFAIHNFLKDPPFARMDMVCCRNSLIYVEPVLQKKALTTFHYALKDKGFLLLGRSETNAHASELYTVFDNTQKIYQRKQVKSSFLHSIEATKAIIKSNDHDDWRKDPVKNDFQKCADDVVLAHYAPAGVVVNREMDIVQFRGATGNWLEASPGMPNLNVLKMARDGLAFELRNVLHKVRTKKKTLAKTNIPMLVDGREQLVTIEVIPLTKMVEPHYLILFKNEEIPTENKEHSQAEDGGNGLPSKSRDKMRISRLLQEMVQLRGDMNSITQEQEAANDALQNANEELLSGSEELQSLNEELETSKEESQTSNEELMILNQELFDRNEQLNILKLYAESIVTTIREPLVILDKNLCVKSANRAFYHKFQLFEEETEGKLIFDLGKKDWDVPSLRQKLEKVNVSRTSLVDFEMTRKFSSIGERTMQLNATRIYKDKSQDHFILLAMEDITEKRKVEQALKEVADLMEKQVADRTSSLKEINAELNRSNKNLEQFAYIASHDLQEPLRKIRTFTGMLNDRYVADLPPAAKELLVRISTSAERMTILIKDVLSFSKALHADTGFEKTDLNAILQNVLRDFDLVITEKKAVVNWQHLPVIEAIPLQMNQLFQNLVSNALKFCNGEKPPVITITHFLLTLEEVQRNTLLDDSLVYCEIDIKDNGVGFEQQYADQVFVLFNRLHGRKEFTGTGIGLALCKSIVINHHGDISAESALNEGALFKIILPVTQREWKYSE